MQVTRTFPIQFEIKPISESTLSLKFLMKGSRDIIRIDTRIVIYFKNTVHRNMIDMISSDILSVLTSGGDKICKALVKVPKFKNYTQSYIIFAINQNESLYNKVLIEDISVEFLSQKIDAPIVEEISLSNSKNFKTNETINRIRSTNIEKKDVRTLEEFDQIVRNNRTSTKFFCSKPYQ
jgi:hypothetical protein